MALSFYPRLKRSTQVTENHVILVFEKCWKGGIRWL